VLSLKDDVIFVFGGDAFDKGPWDIRFGNQLVALKKRYPERVVLIIGMFFVRSDASFNLRRG
jgi:hypothetical protein